MGRFTRRTNTRHLLFQWAMNNFFCSLEENDSLFFLATNEIVPREECNMKMFEGIRGILVKQAGAIREKIKQLPDSRKLRCCTDIICVLALAEFEYLGRSKKIRALIIQEYLKLTDAYSPGNHRVFNFVIDQLL
jgi:hypothetical protein